MPTATRSAAPEAAAPAAWPVLLGYNAPFALWTAYALAKPALASRGLGLPCPTDAMLGWCPACGMTGTYAGLLHHGRLPDAWTGAVLLGFLATAAWSVHRVRTLRHAHRRSAATP